jgi:hypothetical protein
MHRTALLLLLLISLARAEGLASERIWTGIHGNTLRGTYLRTIDEGRKIQIGTADNRLVTIATANLIEADRKLVEAGHNPAEASVVERLQPAGDPAKFKPDPVFDRSRIPVLDADKLGLNHRWSTGAMGGFIMWWDRIEWIEVPRGREFIDKAQWVDSRLDRFSGKNTTVAGVEDIMKGFAHYFDSRFEDEASYRFHLEYDLSPARLAQLASGPNACLLYARVGEYGPYFALLEATPDGRLKLGIDGQAIDATLVSAPDLDPPFYHGDYYEVPLPGGGRRQVGVPSHYDQKALKAYRVKIRDRGVLPKELQDPGDDIVVGRSRPLIVFRPYLFAEKGEKAPPPPEPGFQFPEREPAAKKAR